LDLLIITGSTGLIGRTISSKLPFPQKRVIRKQAFDEQSTSDYSYVSGNLSDPFFVDHVTSGASSLLHLACQSNPRNSNENLKEHLNQDLVTSVSLFESFAKRNPDGHIIFASTGGNMYHSGPPYIPRTEKDLPMPSSGYGIMKLSVEHYLRLLTNIYGIRATVLRITNPYGILLPASRKQGLIGIAFNQILSGEPLTIFDALESVRDYIHLDDVTTAFQCVVKNVPKKGEFRLFNVSSGMGYSLHEILSLIEEITGRVIKKEYAPDSFASASWSVLSHQHLTESLEWTPKMDLKSGLARMWNSIVQQRDSHDIF
jgi:UDP-glucose 4-epimerase